MADVDYETPAAFWERRWKEWVADASHRLCVEFDTPCGEDCAVWAIEAAESRET